MHQNRILDVRGLAGLGTGRIDLPETNPYDGNGTPLSTQIIVLQKEELGLLRKQNNARRGQGMWTRTCVRNLAKVQKKIARLRKMQDATKEEGKMR